MQQPPWTGTVRVGVKCPGDTKSTLAGREGNRFTFIYLMLTQGHVLIAFREKKGEREGDRSINVREKHHRLVAFRMLL